MPNNIPNLFYFVFLFIFPHSLLSSSLFATSIGHNTKGNNKREHEVRNILLSKDYMTKM